MANPAHEALFRQGLAQWNHWRTLNASVHPDLSGLKMTAATLRGADLSHANLRGAVLIRSRLEGADLRYAELQKAQLQEADLSDADLVRANLENAFLAGAKLARASLVGANLRGAQVTVADFRNADFRDADLEDADLRESMGRGASLERANLTGAHLSGCILAECRFDTATGITSRQIESAIIDETTVLPESFQTRSGAPSLDSLASALEGIRARLTGPTVPESDVSFYHHLLAKLSSLDLGLSVDAARVAEQDLVRAVTSRSGGRRHNEHGDSEAAHRWVDAALLRDKLETLLGEIRRQAT